MKSTDNPGVTIPPPLLYAATFIAGIYIQKVAPLTVSLFDNRFTKIAGACFILLFIIVTISSLRQFFVSKNTIITIKPASSLQTTGLYRFTRNPMYLGLLFLYSGLTCFWGNCYNLILLPFLILIIQQYVIAREEKYLLRRFGAEYTDYRNRVRRWI